MEKQRDKIRAFLDEVRSKSLKSFIISMMIDKHSPFGLELSQELKLATDELEQNSIHLLAQWLDDSEVVPRTPEAFALIWDALDDHILDLAREMQHRRLREFSAPPFSNSIERRVAEVRHRLEHRLQNHRAAFTGLGPGADSSTKGRERRGRPPKYDWEGALIHMVVEANCPDGLPTDERGGQAQIEKMIEDWFISSIGDAPSISEIRKRAQGIVELSSRRSKAGN